jgi:hypothetical protein
MTMSYPFTTKTQKLVILGIAYGIPTAMAVTLGYLSISSWGFWEALDVSWPLLLASVGVLILDWWAPG